MEVRDPLYDRASYKLTTRMKKIERELGKGFLIPKYTQRIHRKTQWVYAYAKEEEIHWKHGIKAVENPCVNGPP